MGYQEKKSIMGIFATLITNGIYIGFIIRNYILADLTLVEDVSFWGKVLVMLVPVTIVSRIIIEILFIIVMRITTGDTEPGFEDERDKMITLKAHRVAYVIFSIAIFAGFGLLAVGLPIQYFFVTLWGAGILAETSEHSATLTYYLRGF